MQPYGIFCHKFPALDVRLTRNIIVKKHYIQYCIKVKPLHIYPISVPSEPLNFAANVKSNTTVQLSWKVPLYHHGVIKEYKVYYKKTTENIVFGPETTNETGYILENLKPYTNYSFWVYAATSAGMGNRSATIYNVTYEGG